jgi:MFS family permease
MSRDLILGAVMAAACLSFISIPLSGHISDRIGRKKMYLIGVVAHWAVGLSVFRFGRHGDPVVGVHRHRAVTYPA